MKLFFAIFTFMLLLKVFSGNLQVVRVLPNKINYALNENAVITVTIANRNAGKEKAELVLFDKWDLDQEKIIAKIPVQMEGNSEKTFSIPWNTGTVRYGHESRAVLMSDSKVLAAKSEFFNVINEWWRVNIGVWPSVIGGTEQGDRLCRWYGYRPYNTPFDRFFYKSWGKSPIGPFASYFTCWTPWNMSFSTFGVFHDPSFKDDELWYAVAEGAEGRRYIDFKRDTAFARKWGVRRTKYLAQHATGNPGFELMRKHPQWFHKDAKGDFAYYDTIDPLGLSYRCVKPYTAGWSHTRPNFALPEVLKHGVDTTLDSVKRHGFDGVYFDGIFCLTPGFDHEGWDVYKKFNKSEVDKKISDYIIRRFAEFRKNNPDFYHWANGTPTASSGFNGFRIFASPASGSLWEIGEMPMNPKIEYMNVWGSLKEAAVNVRNKYWSLQTTPNQFDVKTNILHVGYTSFPDGLWMVGPSAVAWGRKGIKFKNFQKTHQFWNINSHVAAIIAAICGHPYALGGAAYRPFTQIMTRYSRFYWHENIRIVKKAFRKFSVDALRDIWWEDFVYINETPEYRDYYIHLLNVPDTKNLSFETVQETLPAKDVEISSRIFKDINKVQAWTIQPYGLRDVVLEPVVSRIKPEQVEDEIVLSIPDFRYYTLLVIREQKT